jgi:glutamate transport system substrate-binding protein
MLALTGAACGGEDDEAATTGAGAGTGAGEAQTSTFPAGSTMAKIQEKGKLVVGTKFDQPLFGQKNPTGGGVEGFDAEIARQLAKDLTGSEDNVEFVEAVSKNREPFITDGKVDLVVATYTINDKRKQVVSFAGPYYTAGQDIMVKSDNENIKGVDDLNGKNVCSVEGSTSEANIKEKAPQAKVLLFDTYSKCAEALGDGRVEAVSTDNVILLGLIQKSNGAFKLVGNPFTEEPYGIGVKKDDTEFRNWINDRLEAMYKDGRWQKAFEDTVGQVEKNTPEPPAVDRYQ